MASSEPRPARDRILFQLKTKGPRTAAQLAETLGVTPMAVRQHLQALAAESLVSFRDERRKVGRPARLWELAPQASGRFPDTHADLTVDLLRAMKAAFGEEGLDRVVTERSRAQKAAYLSRMPAAAAPLEERVEALAELRRAEGYMAEWTRGADGSILLAENHCPICAAATVCQGFCRDELAIFRELLGPAVSVTREEHIPSGARRCAYRIAPAGAATSDARPSNAGNESGAKGARA